MTEPIHARSDGTDDTPSGPQDKPSQRRSQETDPGPLAINATHPDALISPVSPTDDVRDEITALVQADESRLGAVYRGLQRDLTADKIAAELQIETSNFVWNYKQTLKALLEGDLPAKPSVTLSVSRKFRTLLKNDSLSPAARRYLQTNLTELERRSNDTAARVAEAQEAHEQTEKAESRNDFGIYAYTLPHYLRYRFDPETGRTLMKVGRSDSDIIQRFRAQTRTTALPEEPILLRIYKTDGRLNAETESKFHRLLKAADHTRSVARMAGREWFVTSTKFLDEVARVLDLTVVVVNETIVDDD